MPEHEPPPDDLPDPTELADNTRQEIIDELLTLTSEFFSQASPTVLDELRQFLSSRGHTSSTSLDWFIDTLAFSTLRLKD